MTGSSTSSVVMPCEEAVAGVDAAALVDRHEHRQVVDLRELEVLGAGARGDVDDPAALVERDLVPGDDAVHDPLLRREVVERPRVLEPDELLATRDAVVLAAGALGEPPAPVAAARTRRPA